MECMAFLHKDLIKPKIESPQELCHRVLILIEKSALIREIRGKRLSLQATSGLRTIRIRAIPVIAPATNPLVTAITVVPSAGAMEGP